MRRTSKASSAGSTSGWSARLGSLRRPSALALLTLALVAAACLIPSPALAAETRVPIETFGPDGTSGTSFEFSEALAFDQGSKRLYGLDQGPAKIYGFDASAAGTHTPLGGNFPLTAPGSAFEYVDDLAVDSASHHFFYNSEAKAFSAEPSLFGFDSSGAALGGNFPIGGFSDPCGVAVDPSGNVWVSGWVDAAPRSIRKYDPSGTPVPSDTVDTTAQGFPCHIAFDSQANLYVSLYEGGVWKYSAADGYATATEIDPAGGTYPFGSNAIAVDRSSDQLYITHSDHVSVYDSSGAFLYEFGATVAGAKYVGIAVNQATDEVYASDFANETIQVFGPPVPLPTVTTEDAGAVMTNTATLKGAVNPEGKQLTDCHFEYGTTNAYGSSAPCVPAAASISADSSDHSVSADISGLNPNTTYHLRLVAANAEGTANGLDRTFTTAIGPPVISAQSVEAVGASDAMLSAKVNPKGAKTTYHVEYGTTAAYGQSTPESAPIGFPTDDSDHVVSVHIGGLDPGTAYHFRFVATSLVGSAQGSDTTFATYPAPPPPAAPCPNDDFRTGFGARLPDCRAYEQATPTDKHGANMQAKVEMVEAASGGNRVTFLTNGGLPTSGGSSTLSPFMASRGAAGWSSDGLLPTTEAGQVANVLGWSEDLATSVSEGPGPGNAGAALYLRDSDTAAFQPGVVASNLENPFIAGFAADTLHLIFETNVALVPGAVSGFKYNLYDLDHGAATLVGRIPAGSATSCDDANGPACEPAPDGAFAGPYAWQSFAKTAQGGAAALEHYYTQNTISRDGSRVFFTTRNAAQLYVREDGTGTTRVSASQRTVPDPNGAKPAAFMAATPDGSVVFFTSCEKLTDDSTAVSEAENSCTTPFSNQGQDLYSYDVDTGELTDLTVDSNAGDPKGADVRGVLGVSDDGSYVYFAAGGELAPGGSPGNCSGSEAGETCNLYVSHKGAVAFIARLTGVGEGSDSDNWIARITVQGQRGSRVSADGRTLLFRSSLSLTGYDNTSAACSSFGKPGPCREFFRYNAPDEGLVCVSCNPTGVPPNGHASLSSDDGGFQAVGLHATFLTRNLSADGNRAFFESPDPLLPTDTNGVMDVYEWEAEGSGSCHTSGGCLYLLSSGTSPTLSHFADASADGDHVFVFTDQQLVPTDRDELVDIYDAGVGAGLPSQHVLAPPTCTSTACQANPAPPPEQTPASAAFSGAGNVHEGAKARKCPKGKRKVRRAGKVRCQKAHKQHKRHSNRGGSK